MVDKYKAENQSGGGWLRKQLSSLWIKGIEQGDTREPLEAVGACVQDKPRPGTDSFCPEAAWRPGRPAAPRSAVGARPLRVPTAAPAPGLWGALVLSPKEKCVNEEEFHEMKLIVFMTE